MKCLTFEKLEALATDKAGMKKGLWMMHLSSCQQCKERLEEIKENLSLVEEIKEIRTED